VQKDGKKKKKLGFKQSTIDKGCPCAAFLGLCSLGLIKDIKKGFYTKSLKNKSYAKDAVKFLQIDNSLSDKVLALWNKIQGAPKTHNGQMNVVCALWKAGLIRKEFNSDEK